ncbi:unnamed protein product, partial [Prorocentrum cordatum]
RTGAPPPPYPGVDLRRPGARFEQVESPPQDALLRIPGRSLRALRAGSRLPPELSGGGGGRSARRGRGGIMACPHGHWALRPGAQGTAPGLPAEPDERTSAPLEQNLALKRACRSARRAWHLQPTRKDMELEKPPGAPERPPGGLQDPRVRPRRRTPPAGPQGPCPSSSVIRIQAGLHEAPKETPRDTVDSRSVGARKSRRPRRPFNRTERGPDCATLNSVGSSGVAVSLGGSASQECNLERLRQRRRRSNAA